MALYFDLSWLLKKALYFSGMAAAVAFPVIKGGVNTECSELLSRENNQYKLNNLPHVKLLISRKPVGNLEKFCNSYLLMPDIEEEIWSPYGLFDEYCQSLKEWVTVEGCPEADSNELSLQIKEAHPNAKIYPDDGDCGRYGFRPVDFDEEDDEKKYNLVIKSVKSVNVVNVRRKNRTEEL